jgi:hypothetical protein
MEGHTNMGKASNSGPLDFERLLELSDLRTETVASVPRWGIDVDVMELSAEAVIKARQAATDKKSGEIDGTALMKALLVDSCVNPRFTREQVEALFQKSKEPLDAIYDVIVSLNGLGGDSAKEAEESFPVTEPTDG